MWRFFNIPRGKETSADTWTERNSARYGGGGSWSTYTLDMASGEVFVPVGNPAPDFMPGHRPGANLFTNSLVVLDARTSALKWWHQMAPNDELDLDIGASPMLYWNTKGEPMVAARQQGRACVWRKSRDPPTGLHDPDHHHREADSGARCQGRAYLSGCTRWGRMNGTG